MRYGPARLRVWAQVLRRLLANLLDRDRRRNLVWQLGLYDQLPRYECPCCGYEGLLDHFHGPLYYNLQCPKCWSNSRQRLMALALRGGFLEVGGRDVLHFSPDRPVAALLRARRPASYRCADLDATLADIVLDIESIDLPDASVDLVVASHVLEHVDDRAALREIHRILRPGGEAILLVPIVEGWPHTFEADTIDGEVERLRYFGWPDHRRYYGADFRDRIRSSGFDLVEFYAHAYDCGRYALVPGERIFKALRN
jgi:SAM-dependent methyltransferase